MSSMIALLLAFQVGYSTAPTTEPSSQPATQPAAPRTTAVEPSQSQPATQPAAPRAASVEPARSRQPAFVMPEVYRHNYATKYFGLDDGAPPRTVYVPVRERYAAPPGYYAPYSYYYPGYRRFLFAPAPFIRGNYFNPGPFFRPLGA